MESELLDNSLSENEKGESEERSNALFPYTDVFKKCTPFYLAIGMTFDEYWRGDCELAKFYRQAHEIKQKEKLQEIELRRDTRNYEMWLQGVYNLKAISCALRGADKAPYPEEPFPMSQKEEESMAETDKQMQQNLAFMQSFISSAFNNSYEKGE